RLRAELHLPLFRNLEVLEERQIPVEERRAVDRGHHRWSVDADGSWGSEALGIDELMRREVRTRIAGEDRTQLDVRRSQNGSIADLVLRAGNQEVVQVHAEIPAGCRAEIGAALHLGNSRNLPAIDHATNAFLLGDVG